MTGEHLSWPRLVAIVTFVLLSVGTVAWAQQKSVEADALEERAVALFKAEDYKGALDLQNKACAARRRDLPAGHFDHIDCELNLGDIYTRLGDLESAEKHMAMAVKLYEPHVRANAETRDARLNALAGLGDIQRQLGRPQDELRTLQLELEGRLAIPDHDPMFLASTYNRLGICLWSLNRYDESEAAYKKTLDLLLRLRGPQSPEVANQYKNFAQLYDRAARYDDALVAWEKALAIEASSPGPSDPRYHVTRNDKAGTLYRAGRYRESLALFEDVLAWRKKNLPAGSPAIATSLSNLAVVAELMGDADRAEGYHLEALNIDIKAFGDRDPRLARNYGNLALLYKKRGDYDRAEQLYKTAIALAEAAPQPDRRYIAEVYSNLGNLYGARGDHDRSIATSEKALALRREVLPPGDPAIANSLNNLAAAYNGAGRLVDAVKAILEAIKMMEVALGPDHPDISPLIGNAAALYDTMGLFADSELMHRRALALDEKTYGKDHANIALRLNNLGTLYFRQSRYPDALDHYQRALRIWVAALGPDHPDVAVVHLDLSALYQVMGDLPRALEHEREGARIEELNLQRILQGGSEDQKRTYVASLAYRTYGTLSLHLHRAPDDPEAARIAFETILRRKGRDLEAQTDAYAAVRRNLDPEGLEILEKLARLRTLQSNLVLQGPGQEPPATYQQTLKQVADVIDQLEAAMAQRSKRFAVERQPVTIEAVRARLPAGSALVEYVAYRPSADLTSTITELSWKPWAYAAYVLLPDGTLRGLQLGEAAEIDADVERLRRAIVSRDPEADAIAQRLHRAVLAPVLAVTGSAEHLLLSPDGQLNLLPFDALQAPDGRYVVQSHQLTFLTTGRDLFRLDATASPRSGPMILANPDYDHGAGASGGAVGGVTRGSFFEGLSWARLPGTAAEAESIADLLDGAELIEGEDATESAIKGIHAPTVLHLATHGFFLADDMGGGEDGVRGFVKGSAGLGAAEPLPPANPLLRSGLVWAGANAPPRGQDDGYLTASEVSALDLWGTRLVVMSACETGVGEVRNGHGVYGLRRAMVLAGATSQVMSLWQVSDAATRALMTTFFKGLEGGLGRSEAMRRAKLEVMANPSWSAPFFWAAFIPSGDWRPLGAGGLTVYGEPEEPESEGFVGLALIPRVATVVAGTGLSESRCESTGGLPCPSDQTIAVQEGTSLGFGGDLLLTFGDVVHLGATALYVPETAIVSSETEVLGSDLTVGGALELDLPVAGWLRAVLRGQGGAFILWPGGDLQETLDHLDARCDELADGDNTCTTRAAPFVGWTAGGGLALAVDLSWVRLRPFLLYQYLHVELQGLSAEGTDSIDTMVDYTGDRLWVGLDLQLGE